MAIEDGEMGDVSGDWAVAGKEPRATAREESAGEETVAA